MASMEKLKFWLWEFCRELSERRERGEELVNAALRLVERENLAFKAALLRVADERPELARDPAFSPLGDPLNYLDEWAERYSKRFKTTYEEAFQLAIERFPQLHALAELMRSDWGRFLQAAEAVGRMAPDFARDRAVELILEEARRLAEEAE